MGLSQTLIIHRDRFFKTLSHMVLQAENATFLEEIDSTSRIYEQTQGENSSLVKRVMDGDARLNQMSHAQLKHKQSLDGCKADLQAAQQASNHSSQLQLQQTLHRQVHQLQTALQVRLPPSSPLLHSRAYCYYSRCESLG